MTCAYVMYKKRVKFDAALTIVSAFRVCSSPNSGFREQLLKYEAELFKEE